MAIVGFTLTAMAVHYVLQYIYALLGINDITYLSMKCALSFMYLAAFMPFCIKRMNDIQMSKWWVAVFWLEAIFSLRNIVLVEMVWGIQINPFSWPLAILALGSLVLGLVLIFKPGTHNNALNHDLGDATRPSAC